MVALALKSLMAATAASLLVAFLPEVPPYDANAGSTSSQFSSLLRRMLSSDALGRVLRYLMKCYHGNKKGERKASSERGKVWALTASLTSRKHLSAATARHH
jgi:hypothetical protein